jgi:hypothetical protein
MTESDIQLSILNYLHSVGVYAWRNNTTGVFDPKSGQFRRLGAYAIKGVSDILGVLPDGKLLAIEVKTKKGRVSKAQEMFIQRINNKDGVAFVARSLEDVKEKFKELECI